MQSLNNDNNDNNKKDNNSYNNEYVVIFYDRVHCYKYIEDNNLHRYYFSNSVFRKIFTRKWQSYLYKTKFKRASR